MERDESAREGVELKERLSECHRGEIQASAEHEQGARVHRANRFDTGTAAGGLALAGVPGLKEQKVFTQERVHPPLDLVDAAEDVLEGAGVVDRGSNEPHLGQRQSDQEDRLARWRHRRDAPQERRERGGGDGDTPIERGHAKGHESVEGLVLFHEHTDLPLRGPGLGWLGLIRHEIEA